MENLVSLVNELITLPKETEWLEFKRSYADSDEIGEYISALSNSATYHGRSSTLFCVVSCWQNALSFLAEAYIDRVVVVGVLLQGLLVARTPM